MGTNWESPTSWESGQIPRGARKAADGSQSSKSGLSRLHLEQQEILLIFGLKPYPYLHADTAESFRSIRPCKRRWRLLLGGGLLLRSQGMDTKSHWEQPSIQRSITGLLLLCLTQTEQNPSSTSISPSSNPRGPTVRCLSPASRACGASKDAKGQSPPTTTSEQLAQCPASNLPFDAQVHLSSPAANGQPKAQLPTPSEAKFDYKFGRVKEV